MEAEDFDDEDAVPGAPLPPPAERRWRHPSEMAAAGAGRPDGPVPIPTPLPAARPAPLRPAWQVALAAGVASAAAVVAMVTLTGGLGRQLDAREGRVATAGMVPVTLGIGLTSAGLDTSSVAARARPWVGRVEADGAVVASGLVYRRGHLLTTASALDDTGGLAVVLPDGQRVPAELVGVDPGTDVAVLALDGAAAGAAPAELGSAAELRVGEPVVAMCSHAGPVDRPSVVAGSISALGRQIQAGDDTVLHDLVQLDLSAPLGASGGVLLDRAGRVVGLTTAAHLAGPGIGGRHLGFAIPIDVARDVADDLIGGDRPRRARLGIDGTDVAPGSAGPGVGSGALVHAVAPGGPARKAGLVAGDVIVGLDGQAVTSMSQLVVRLSNHDPGERVMLVVWRDGARRTIWAELGERAPAG